MCVPALPKFFRPVTRNTLIFLFGLKLSCCLIEMLQVLEHRIGWDEPVRQRSLDRSFASHMHKVWKNIEIHAKIRSLAY